MYAIVGGQSYRMFEAGPPWVNLHLKNPALNLCTQYSIETLLQVWKAILTCNFYPLKNKGTKNPITQ